MLLSICITVYNQIDFVRDNLLEIISYKGDDIEIVVTDDGSTDPIEEMIHDIGDARIRYCKTLMNKSHDGNIINGIKECRGDWILLLRSKDTIISANFHDVLSIIKQNPDASYFLFSAVDENNRIKLLLPDKKYSRGMESQMAHDKLLIHPSGQIYKRKYLRPDVYESYIDSHFPEYNGCCVHQLIRMDLAVTGEFVTSSVVGWRYVNTLQLSDVSTIKTKTHNIYAPYYLYQRYKCEWDFVSNEIEALYRKEFYDQLIIRYSKSIVVDFITKNRNKRIHAHYSSKKEKFSPYKEALKFKKITMLYIDDLIGIDQDEMQQVLKEQMKKILIFGIPKGYIKSIFINIDFLRTFVYWIRRKRTMRRNNQNR